MNGTVILILIEERQTKKDKYYKFSSLQDLDMTQVLRIHGRSRTKGKSKVCVTILEV
jgi:hypothetical protein